MRICLRLMRSHGLFLVYLGIESGTDEGLRLMNKRATVRDNLTAVNTLKRLGIDADYGSCCSILKYVRVGAA